MKKTTIKAEYLSPNDVVEDYGTVANIEDFDDHVEVSFWNEEGDGPYLFEFDDNETVVVIDFEEAELN